MKIVVLDGYTLNPGDNPWTEAEILLTNKTPVRRESIARLPLLRYIGVLATGRNIVDAAAYSSAQSRPATPQNRFRRSSTGS